jgi:uncharacterized protein YegP (UPF0339 family)
MPQDPRPSEYFELWSQRTLMRGVRFYWHCKSAGNHEIVFSGQASGYSSKANAEKGIAIARRTSELTPIVVRQS